MTTSVRACRKKKPLEKSNRLDALAQQLSCLKIQVKPLRHRNLNVGLVANLVLSLYRQRRRKPRKEPPIYSTDRRAGTGLRIVLNAKSLMLNLKQE